MSQSGAKAPVTQAAPSSANVLDGYATSNSTAGPTTLLTVPAGRTWVGTLTLQAAISNAAANAVNGNASVGMSIAGVGSTPPNGNVAGVVALCGANAATGTVGSQDSTSVSVPLTIIAPAGNSVLLQWTSSFAGTSGLIIMMATGALQ